MSNFWKEIQNYSGCTDFEQLQFYLNIIYKFEIKLEDFQTQHPVYLAKFIHLHQLAFQYYEYSSDQLIVCEKQIEKQTIDTQDEIKKLEQSLIESKVKIKNDQKKLQQEQKQKDKFVEKVLNTQLIQCAYCDKILTTDSQFSLHMQSYHKREFNKQEVDVINKAIQNQLLTQQLSNRVVQQNQQNYLALNFQFLQTTKDQLSQETIDFIKNTMDVKDKIEMVEKTFTNKIQNLEEEIQNKVQIIKFNAENEEKIREEQLKEKVKEMENLIKTEFEKSKTMIFKQKSFKRLPTASIVTKSQEGQQQQSVIQSSNLFYSQQGMQRGATMNIYSLANIEPDEMIENQQENKTSLQQFQIKITQQNNEKSEQNLDIQQSQKLSESLQQSSGSFLPQNQKLEYQESHFGQKRNLQQEEDEPDEVKETTPISNEFQDVDYYVENLERYRDAVQQQQKFLLGLLQNRSRGERASITQLQKSYYLQILEEKIAPDLVGYETNDLKMLKKQYDDLGSKVKQLMNNVEQKLQLYSFNEESQGNTNEEAGSRRETQFLNINSRYNSNKHSRNPSSQTQNN